MIKQKDYNNRNSYFNNKLKGKFVYNTLNVYEKNNYKSLSENYWWNKAKRNRYIQLLQFIPTNVSFTRVGNWTFGSLSRNTLQ